MYEVYEDERRYVRYAADQNVTNAVGIGNTLAYGDDCICERSKRLL